MIIGAPQEDCTVRGYPCDNKDCKLYREWGAVPVEQEKRKRWYTNPSDLHAPKWACFGVAGCENCKYFKGLDLYIKEE